MCGIAGAIGTLDPTLPDAVRRMNARQAHRGPDGEGFWTSPASPDGAGAVLAHRRLAIIDLSADGRQPMIDPETGHTITFNGEIYNYRELRAELAALGHPFRTKTDTEVILRAYKQWGGSCVTRLRGMFTFAIWDADRREVLLARDRVGIKPLYWAEVRVGGRNAILFASEVRAILETGLVQRRISPSGLSSFLWNGFVVGPDTFIRGIHLLPPGTTAAVRPESPAVEPSRYWRIPAAAGRSNDTASVRACLTEAVKQHLVSDVPLGVFLSGGVDSSAIAALAVRFSPKVQTYNVSFEESKFDEAPYARQVAEALGTEHHEFRLTQRLFTDGLESALGSLDQPTFDAINTYFVSRIVREAGATVALAGTGGDELFGGYTSFSELPRLRRVSRLGRRVPRRLVKSAVRVKVGASGGFPPQTRWGKLPDAMATGGRLLELYQVAYGLFTSEFLQELAVQNGEAAAVHSGIPDARAAELRELISSSPDLTGIAALELSCFLGERLLRDTDAASMASSLEVRVPLLDHEFIESLAGLDEQTRFSPVRSKRLLKELALGDLDPAIFDRPKSGFVLPLEVWCKQKLGGEVAATLMDADLCRSVGLDPGAVDRIWTAFQAGAPGLYWSRIWALFIVLWWSRTHGAAR